MAFYNGAFVQIAIDIGTFILHLNFKGPTGINWTKVSAGLRKSEAGHRNTTLCYALLPEVACRACLVMARFYTGNLWHETVRNTRAGHGIKNFRCSIARENFCSAQHELGWA